MDAAPQSNAAQSTRKVITFEEREAGREGQRKSTLTSTTCPSLIRKAESYSSVILRTVSRLEAFAGDDLADDLLQEEGDANELELEEGDDLDASCRRGAFFHDDALRAFDVLTLDWETPARNDSDAGLCEEGDCANFEELMASEIPAVFAGPRLTTRCPANDELCGDAVCPRAHVGAEGQHHRIPVPPLGGGFSTGFAFMRSHLSSVGEVSSEGFDAATAFAEGGDCAGSPPSPSLVGAAGRALLRSRATKPGSA